jgi:molecular chaperone DnaJ
MQRDPYEVLGVGRDADETQIKKSFRKLARELHPDVNTADPEAENKFKECAEAYEILSDADRRATYDRYGHEGLRSGGYAPNFDSFGSIADIFESFFGGGARQGGPASGGDVAAAIELDLGQAATGGTFEVAYEAVDRCAHCKGNGAEPGTPIETCARCGGAGRLQAVTRTPFGQMMRTITCDVCNGDGRTAVSPCGECRGRGRRLARRKVSVQVPGGIADGQRIRIGGNGHVGEPGAPAGDLHVVVTVRADDRFIREDDDLITVVDVSAPLAALGATVAVPTLDGPTELEVAPGTQPGDVLTLRGRGMPHLRRGGTGDLRIVVNVVVPRHLSRDQRRLVEELAETMTDENLRSDESVFAKLKRALRPHAA